MQRFTYPVTLTPDEVDGGYVVACRDAPEVVTQGESIGCRSTPDNKNNELQRYCGA